MGIALHELVTNAIKFGALAQPGGSSRLRISWTVADDALDFEWSERGVPIVAPAPRPEGFGQEYIERVLPYQLDATSSFEVAPGGLTCRIHLPLHQGAGVADPYGQ
jgi:two-component system CheB/CheR fusion protein